MKHKGDLLLFLAAFIGGSGFISSKYLLDWGYTPYQVIFGRFLVAALCLGIFYWKAWKSITKSEWKVGSILGLILAATFLLLTLGLQYTTPVSYTHLDVYKRQVVEKPKPQEEPKSEQTDGFTAVDEQVTAKSETNLRDKPSMEGTQVVHTLKNGEYVKRIGINSNGWSKLEYNGQVVYAISSYLTN